MNKPLRTLEQQYKRRSWMIALLLHAAVLTVALVLWYWPRTPAVETEGGPISVDLIAADSGAAPRTQVESVPQPVEKQPPAPAPKVQADERPADIALQQPSPKPKPTRRPTAPPTTAPDPAPTPLPKARPTAVASKPTSKPASKATAQPAQAEDAAERLATNRNAELARLMKQAGQSAGSGQGESAAAGSGQAGGSGGQGAGKGGLSAAYKGRIAALIRRHTSFNAESVEGNPRATIEIRMSADGTILGRPRLVRSSGNEAWDEAAVRAAIATAVIPRDPQTGKAPPSLVYQHGPKDE